MKINRKFLLGVVGVAIAVALLSSIIAVTSSLQYGFLGTLVDEQGGMDALVIPENAEEVLSPLPWEPGSFSYSLRSLERSEDLSAVVIKLDLAQERKMGIDIAEKLEIHEGGAAITTALSEDMGLDIGDFIKIDNIRYRIDGLVSEGRRRVYLSPPIFEPNVGIVQFNDRDDFYSNSPEEIIEASKEIGREISETPWGPDVIVILPIAQGLKSMSTAMPYLTATFTIVAAIALIVASVLIFSIISMRAEEREKEFAIFRAIGRRKSGIFLAVIKESLAISALGAGIGALIGFAFSAVLARALSTPIELWGWPLFLPISIGIIVGILSGLYPAYSSSRKEIAQSLDPHRRGIKSGKFVMERGPSTSLVAVGFLTSFLSLFTFFVMPALAFKGDGQSMLMIIMALMVSMIVGLALIGVGGLAPLLEKGVFKLVKAISSGIGLTAETYAKRHRRRNATTSVMFSIAICFTVFISSVYALQDRSADVTIPYGNGADIMVTSSKGFPEGFTDDMAYIDGIESISFVTIGVDCLIGDDIGFERPIGCILYGVDENLASTIYPEFINIKGSLPRYEWEVTLPASIASSIGAKIGGRISLTFEGEAKELMVVGIARALPGFPGIKENANKASGGTVLCASDFLEGQVGRAFINLGPGAGGETAEEIKKMASLYPYDPITISVTSDDVVNAKKAADFLLAGLYVILILSVLIAFFGLVTSSYVSIKESSFEIGVLRALGIRDGSIRAIFTMEATMIALSSSVSGIVMGSLVGWLYGWQQQIMMEMPATSPFPPISVIVAIIAVSLVLGPMATRASIRGLIRRTPAEVLRSS